MVKNCERNVSKNEYGHESKGLAIEDSVEINEKQNELRLQWRSGDEKMITAKDLYVVLTALVPLYVAMFVGYGSVRWWKIFNPAQCAGINRFVAVFAIPLLSLHFISTNNPYAMDAPFILSDTVSKLAIFLLLVAWAKFSSYGSLDWLITLFSLSTLPNTLVMGIPLLTAMYGPYYQGLMVQMVVLQSIVWYTLLLFLFELRAARLLLLEQFPDTAASIVSFKVDADVVSLDGREPLQTQAQIGDDGKIHVIIRRSVSSSQPFDLFAGASPRRSVNLDLFGSPRRSSCTMPPSRIVTPRPSNLSGVEIYSFPHSSQNTPRDHNHSFIGSLDTNFGSIRPASSSPRLSNLKSVESYSIQSSRCPTARASNCNNESTDAGGHGSELHSPVAHAGPLTPYLPPAPAPAGTCGTLSSHAGVAHRGGISFAENHVGVQVVSGLLGMTAGHSEHTAVGDSARKAKDIIDTKPTTRSELDDTKELHMFMWSSSTSPPISENDTFGGNRSFDTADNFLPSHEAKDTTTASSNHKENADGHEMQALAPSSINVGTNFSFVSRANIQAPPAIRKQEPDLSNASVIKAPSSRKPKEMPSSSVMMKLILQMVGRKLLRNPNTYASVLGVIWSLIGFRFGISMPTIISESLKILWQAGLGMAMFSLGLFMALQPRIIACGAPLAVFAMAVRFLTGPAVMAASSIAVGLRGVKLHAAVVQAALPQGVVPFVFSREYDLHPDVLSTAVIFGMIVALPVTILYYVLLGL